MKVFDRWLGRSVVNAIFGVAGLVVAHILGLGLGITMVNLLVTVFLGIPGLALLMGAKWLF